MVTSGTRLGPYEVVSPLGAGGMGEVYAARDTRLERSVAIKILPSDFAQNAQLRARFEREAKSISQLTHPNICTLFDVGDGYIVMELLDGQTLAERIAKGPLPLDQVIRYGVQIADALGCAHRAGIVHRDVKPGNIMLTKSGAKLLDFGLAKESEPVVVQALTSHRTEKKSLTEEGTILGTFQYMAPEQLEGGEADARTDIFALGAVLYEMATGRKAFGGKSKASLIASILTAEPQSIKMLQPASPESLDRLIRVCMAKEPDERMQSAHDVGMELRWIADAAAASSDSTRHRRSRAGWLAAASLAVISVLAGGALLREEIARRNAPPVRTSVLPPDKFAFAFDGPAAPPAISPDGTRIVFGVTDGAAVRQLYLRRLDQPIPQPVPGTLGALFPFWSPDGKSIGFFADGKLKKMALSGGMPIDICEVADGRGGSWSSDGSTIIFSGRYTPVYRVAAGGGTPVAVTTLKPPFGSHRWPEFLPDGRHFVYLSTVNGTMDSQNFIAAGATDGKLQKALVSSANNPLYCEGYLLFTRDHVLMAQAFDAKKIALRDDAVALRESQVETVPLFSRSILTVSREGTLVYQGGTMSRDSRLAWFDRAGRRAGGFDEPAPYQSVSLSPDQKKLIVGYRTAAPTNLWVYDLESGAKSRLTLRGTYDFNPLVSPDGTKVAYSAGTGQGGIPNSLFFKDEVTGLEERVLSPSGDFTGVVPTGWSSDGKILVFSMSGSPTRRSDVCWMSMADRKPHVAVSSPAIEMFGRLSPNGKWLSYQSNESGRFEVYLAPFPPNGSKWQVSANGGVVPRWRADGRELLYLSLGPNMSVVAVPVTLQAPPVIGVPAQLFTPSFAATNTPIWEMTGDAKRFLVATRLESEAPPQPLTVVQHFDNELRAVMERRE